jgi:hypothetical protein
MNGMMGHPQFGGDRYRESHNSSPRSGTGTDDDGGMNTPTSGSWAVSGGQFVLEWGHVGKNFYRLFLQ